ncbi:hypothetical protein F503_04435 [Ophiostoma piceae UAMH 11346]|uniref:polynucleotide adenylyltransferase n=1 Tax=Ophiostoma piceae (strain UAMH 11346) TaxID=1262450 RepID=S3CQI5_OPHP1|nr:hypothetical protein F503_04435 [Ophiostoma piceae UAMH 11346]
MATTNSKTASFSLNSHATALCIIPPEECWASIDRLRSLYDKAYRKWPPHVNLIYPFVQPESLEAASQRISKYVQSESPGRLDIYLNTAGVFTHRQEKTLFLRDGRNDESAEPLLQLQAGLVAALVGRSNGEQDKGKSSRMHMTVAQSSGSTPYTSPASDVDGADPDVLPSDTLGHAYRFLLHKVENMPPISWQVDRLHVLVRERLTRPNAKHSDRDINTSSSRMRLWGVLHLATGIIEKLERSAPFYQELPVDSIGQSGEDVADDETVEALRYPAGELPAFQAVTYAPEEDEWIRCSDDPGLYSSLPAVASPGSLSISTYNVLAEFEWPPKEDRFPLLLKNIVASNAAADVLVLQEVTDHFLSALLADHRVRSAYPFASHGPPNQLDMDPLSSHLNMVVLSRRPFSWTWLGFERPHKGALIARFSRQDDDDYDEQDSRYGLVLATVHLTHGLTNGSVSAKRNELQHLFNHLQQQYPPSMADTVVVAGDLNIHTSSFAVDAAVRRKGISMQSAQYVETGFDDLFSQHGFVDAYSVVEQFAVDNDEETDEVKHERRHHNSGIAMYDGEEGSTYNPFTNALAARIVGSGLNTRPERFDRILVRGSGKSRDDSGVNYDNLRSSGSYAVTHYNTFGFPPRTEDYTSPAAYASDHWGIRCTLGQVFNDVSDIVEDDGLAKHPEKAEAEQKSINNQHISADVEKLIVPVEPAHAPAGPLADPESVASALGELSAIPLSDDIARRKAAFERLQAIILNASEEAEVPPTANKLPRQLVVVPVGSYGLGVWTPASDIDCLCIGAFGAQTFFTLANQRLRAAGAAVNADPESSVRIIRRVRAHTGTMMELEVNGIRMDLQYCSAGLIAETWPAALVLPPTHPIFTISPHILSKLKAARDLYYLRKSFPETTSSGEEGDAGDAAEHEICTATNFRTAHRAIKAWARSRGLYAARFGYLGGIQIAILLARVMKLMQREINNAADDDSATTTTPYTIADILVTFFQHYAGFDWKTKMAFDPYFHNEKPPYSPTSREPLAILGYHRPQLNTSMAASVPSVRVLAEEFQRASRLFTDGSSGLTWSKFLRGGNSSTSDSGPEENGGLSPGPAEFVQTYRSYVKIDLQYWGLSLSRGSAFVGWLESRCVLLLVDLARRLPELNARIWPGRFVEVDEHGKNNNGGGEESAEGDRQYQGCYLIGLELPESMAREERRVALGTLQSVLAHFEKQIRRGGDGHTDLTNFDPQWQWVGINITNRADIGDASRLRLDSRAWGEYTLGDDENDEDDDDEEDAQDSGDIDAGDDSAEDGDHDLARAKASKKSKGKDKDKKKLPMAVVHRPNGGAKFRTAQDVIKRLRWDPHLDRSDFIVGYEDRFLGAREKPLEMWKSEQTDEEFIPQHRILYFRRRSDDVIVWDRRTRKDVIFGSGVRE